jgi:3',5'-cyclic-AMP phosphodiesterase
MKRSLKSILLLFLVLTGCSDAFEYSPNQISDNDSPTDLNRKNLLKLGKENSDDTITIVFAGDSQQFYEELDFFVKKVNTIDNADFILIAGDISDFGLLQEFEWIAERLRKLRQPYLGVIGNHDVVSNGEEVFKKMFGPLNFSFVYDSVKFVFHNTNSREYLSSNVPDLEWLKSEFLPGDAVKHFVGVSHVPPFSGDFISVLESEYTSMLKSTPGFLLSLHGHIHEHTDGYPYEDGIRYITSYAFKQRSLVLLKIVDGTVFKEVLPY